MATLNNVSAIIHPAPAKTSAAAVRTGSQLNATTAVDPAIERVQAHTATSPFMRLHTSVRPSAPITAPKAKGAEHDTVGLCTTMQQIAHNQRHKRQNRAADKADCHAAGQHNLARRRVGDVTQARNNHATRLLRGSRDGDATRFQRNRATTTSAIAPQSSIESATSATMRRSYMSAIAPAGVEISITGSTSAVYTSATLSAADVICIIAQAAPTPWIRLPNWRAGSQPKFAGMPGIVTDPCSHHRSRSVTWADQSYRVASRRPA